MKLDYKEKLHNKIDDYKQTIQAMVGFLNFYRYDDESRKMRDNIKIFQGRNLTPSLNKSTNENGDKIDYVTPDLGILLASNNGVLGEVKKVFHWIINIGLTILNS